MTHDAPAVTDLLAAKKVSVYFVRLLFGRVRQSWTLPSASVQTLRQRIRWVTLTSVVGVIVQDSTQVVDMDLTGGDNGFRTKQPEPFDWDEDREFDWGEQEHALGIMRDVEWAAWAFCLIALACVVGWTGRAFGWW